MAEKLLCLKASFFGKVQGVGFRQFALEKAKALGLKGFVKNCANESVEVEAFGSREELEEFLQILKKGNGFSKALKVSAEFCKAMNEIPQSFEIMHDF